MDFDDYLNNSFSQEYNYCKVYNTPIAKHNKSDLNLTENSNINNSNNGNSFTNNTHNNSKLTIDKCCNDIDYIELDERIYKDNILNLDTEFNLETKVFTKEDEVKEKKKRCNLPIKRNINGKKIAPYYKKMNNSVCKKKSNFLQNYENKNFDIDNYFHNRDLNDVDVTIQRRKSIKIENSKIGVEVYNESNVKKFNFPLEILNLKKYSNKSCLELSKEYLENNCSIITIKNINENPRSENNKNLKLILDKKYKNSDIEKKRKPECNFTKKQDKYQTLLISDLIQLNKKEENLYINKKFANFNENKNKETNKTNTKNNLKKSIDSFVSKNNSQISNKKKETNIKPESINNDIDINTKHLSLQKRTYLYIKSKIRNENQKEIGTPLKYKKKSIETKDEKELNETNEKKELKERNKEAHYKTEIKKFSSNITKIINKNFECTNKKITNEKSTLKKIEKNNKIIYKKNNKNIDKIKLSMNELNANTNQNTNENTNSKKLNNNYLTFETTDNKIKKEESLVAKISKNNFNNLKKTNNQSPEIKNIKRKIIFDEKCNYKTIDNTKNQSKSPIDKTSKNLFFKIESENNYINNSIDNKMNSRNYNSDIHDKLSNNEINNKLANTVNNHKLSNTVNSQKENDDIINSSLFFIELKNNFNQFEKKFSEEIQNKSGYLTMHNGNQKKFLQSIDKQNKFYKEFFSLITVYYNVLLEKNKDSKFPGNNKSTIRDRNQSKNQKQNKSQINYFESGDFSTVRNNNYMLQRELDKLRKEYSELENAIKKMQIEENSISTENNIEILSTEETRNQEENIEKLKTDINEMEAEKNKCLNLLKTNLIEIQLGEKKIYEVNENLISLQQKELQFLKETIFDLENQKQNQCDMDNSLDNCYLKEFDHFDDLNKNSVNENSNFINILNQNNYLKLSFSDSCLEFKPNNLVYNFELDRVNLTRICTKSQLLKRNRFYLDKEEINYDDFHISFRTGNNSYISFQDNINNNKYCDSFNVSENYYNRVEDSNLNFSFDNNRFLNDNSNDRNDSNDSNDSNDNIIINVNNNQNNFVTINTKIRNSFSKSLDKITHSKMNVIKYNTIYDNKMNYSNEKKNLSSSFDKKLLNEKTLIKSLINKEKDYLKEKINLNKNKKLIVNFHVNINNINNNYFNDEKKLKHKLDPEINFTENRNIPNIHLNYKDREIVSDRNNHMKTDLNGIEKDSLTSFNELNIISESIIKDEKDEIMEFYRMLSKNITTGNLRTFLVDGKIKGFSDKNLISNYENNSINKNCKSNSCIGLNNEKS